MSRSLSTTEEKEEAFQSINQVLSRYNKQELLKYVLEENIDFMKLIPHTRLVTMTRKEIADKMCDIATNVTVKHTSLEKLLGKLQLLYLTVHSEKRTWVVYELKGMGNTFKDAESLEKKLRRKMIRNHFECESESLMKQEALWIRLSVRSEFAMYSSPRKEVYFHYFPYLPFLCVSSPLGKTATTHLHQAISDTYAGSEVEPMLLKGTNIMDLLRMAIQKESGLIRDPEHLPTELKKTLKLRKIIVAPELNIPNVVDDDASNERKQGQRIENVFGKYEAPCLKRVTLKMDTKFYGFPGEATDDLRAKCTITFEGSNVIEGLCKLVKGKPVPKYLEELVCSGSDTLFIED